MLLNEFWFEFFLNDVLNLDDECLLVELLNRDIVLYVIN